jgi:hypothetical protein
MTQDQDKLREFARKQLKKKQDFKQYLWTYAGVSVLVTGIWFVTSPEGYFWPIWVIFGMGVGALFSGLDAYGRLSAKPITDADVDAEVERLKRRG